MVNVEKKKDCIVIKLNVGNRIIERIIPSMVLKHIYNERLHERIEELIEYARQNDGAMDF